MDDLVNFENANKLKLGHKLFLLFCGLSVATPFAFIFIPSFMPETETLESWFQRSGAMMVVFALLAESFAIGFEKHLFPKSGFGVKGAQAARVKYFKYPKIMNALAFVLIAIGTFIWGFGDLIV